MTSYTIADVQYPDRSPREVHYLCVETKDSSFIFRAGEIIGQGVAAGGGEGTFDIAGLLALKSYQKFLENIQCPWLDDILKNKNMSDHEKYLNIIEQVKKN